MSNEWFQRRPREEPAEWTSDCDEATHLNTFLTSNASASDTASQLTLPSADPSDSVGEKQWRLWNLVFDIAAELPATQTDLVALLKAFHALDDPGDWTIDWKNLGSFGSVWRDAWESFSARRLRATPSGCTPYSDRWINFNAFSARLVAESLGNVEVVFGFFILRDGLEEELSAEKINVEPSAAAQWILFAGRHIFEAENTQIDDSWNRGLAKESGLWSGAAGFSRARWAFWRARFEELSEVGEVMDEGKGVLKEAARKMREIDKTFDG